MPQENKLIAEVLQELEERNGREAVLWLKTGDMSKDNPGADGKCWPDKDERGAAVGWFFRSNTPVTHATHYVDHPTIKTRGYLEVEHGAPGYDIIIEEVKWPHYYLLMAS
jgi:hypothetical protein